MKISAPAPDSHLGDSDSEKNLSDSDSMDSNKYAKYIVQNKEKNKAENQAKKKNRSQKMSSSPFIEKEQTTEQNDQEFCNLTKEEQSLISFSIFLHEFDSENTDLELLKKAIMHFYSNEELNDPVKKFFKTIEDLNEDKKTNSLEVTFKDVFEYVKKHVKNFCKDNFLYCYNINKRIKSIFFELCQCFLEKKVFSIRNNSHDELEFIPFENYIEIAEINNVYKVKIKFNEMDCVEYNAYGDLKRSFRNLQYKILSLLPNDFHTPEQAYKISGIVVDLLYYKLVNEILKEVEEEKIEKIREEVSKPLEEKIKTLESKKANSLKSSSTANSSNAIKSTNFDNNNNDKPSPSTLKTVLITSLIIAPISIIIGCFLMKTKSNQGDKKITQDNKDSNLKEENSLSV